MPKQEKHVLPETKSDVDDRIIMISGRKVGHRRNKIKNTLFVVKHYARNLRAEP